MTAQSCNSELKPHKADRSAAVGMDAAAAELSGNAVLATWFTVVARSAAEIFPWTC